MNSLTNDGPPLTDNDSVVVIPKEKAVFWLDKEGCWRNAGGIFRIKKIIDYFHRAISRDADGFFVWQDKGGVIEKVYFPYEDTALFVFGVDFGKHIDLTLNTGRSCRLDPERLFIREDSLYLDTEDGPVKFGTRALMKLSAKFEEGDDGRLFVRNGDRAYAIEEK